ncbi:MAG TPA: FAD-binding protein, partial [Bacteroidales bacterium]|nr:FAD-binding protein [Bacteroidales bacterium]
SRAAKERCDAGFGVNETGLAVFLDFSDAIRRLGRKAIEEKYGNLFEMYQKINDEDPYETPMMIYPAIHYAMGGLWVDYSLMTTVPGLFAIGECNFSDHGANRLGASALMQGLADGYFVLPYTISDYLADQIQVPRFSNELPEFKAAEDGVRARLDRIMAIQGKQTVETFHKRLGRIMWDYCGMSRNEAGLTKALGMVQELQQEFWSDVKVPGGPGEFNAELEKAGRVAEFMELGELIIRDALNRRESCGGHFREESQTEEGEAKRDDDNFTYVAAWEYMPGNAPRMHKEPLQFEVVQLIQRNYK